MSFSQHLSVLVTPKIFRDLDNPRPDAQRFFAYYRDLFGHFDELRVILAVGNSDHILTYPGRDGWQAEFPWTRYSNYTIDAEKSRRYKTPLQRVVSDASMNYQRASAMFNALRHAGEDAGCANLGILDLIDPGPEFCEAPFKKRHPEIMDLNDPRNPRHILEDYAFLDFTTTVARDEGRFAAFPCGIAGGTPTGEVVARQAGCYVRDLELDGLWLQNALGAVRPWDPPLARGWSQSEEASILDFYRHLRTALGAERTLIWFDTYWPQAVEHDRWSIPLELYRIVDYVQVATYAVIVKPEGIRPNIESKLAVGAKVIQSIVYVDPWYDYRTFIDYPDNLDLNLRIFSEYKDRLSGIQLWLSDTNGRFLPRPQVEQLLRRFSA